MLIKVVREKALGNAIPSKIYIDGVFYCYGLENDLYKVPAGTYALYAEYSNKFGKSKLFIDVAGRSSIEFHGGNSADDSRGCVLVGKNRPVSDRISGDMSDDLLNEVNDAYRRGESVAVVITNEISKLALTLIAAGVIGLIWMAAK